MSMEDIRTVTGVTELTRVTEDMDTADIGVTGDNLDTGVVALVTPAITRSNSKSGPPSKEP